MSRQQIADRAQRACLAHTPGMDDESTEDAAELLDDVARRRGTSDDDAIEPDRGEIERRILLDIFEEAEPDRRHAKGEIAALLRRKIEDALAIQSRSRQHHLC